MMGDIKKKLVINDILDAMKCIADAMHKNYDGDPYKRQRIMINNVFIETSNNYGINAIILRLVVLDSLYSTNASYSYFSFENIAKTIMGIGEESDVVKYFDDFISKPSKDEKSVFCLRYGIRKNLSEGSKQISLITKYAYYQMMQKKENYPLGFPIYDSLVMEVFPKIYYNILGNEENINLYGSIEQYIGSLNTLRKAIFKKDLSTLVCGMQQFDLLDAYLWRIGKINEGNYSLLLNENDYKKFITNIGLSSKDDKNYGCYMFEKFQGIEFRGKKLIECTQKENKHIQYKYDFNSIVRYQCAKMLLGDILCKIEDNENVIRTLIEHWRVYFNPLDDYNRI